MGLGLRRRRWQLTTTLPPLHPQPATGSTLRVFHRQMQVGCRTWLPVGCIGEVATHPDHRGKGYAAAVLQDAQLYMRRAGYGLAVLHSSQFADYYQKHGWFPVRRLRGRAVHPAPPTRCGLCRHPTRCSHALVTRWTPLLPSIL